MGIFDFTEDQSSSSVFDFSDTPAPVKKESKPTKAKEDPSYFSRVIKEALPAVANTVQDLALSIPAGIRGAGEAIATGSVDRGVEGFQSSMEQLQGTIPRFRSQGAQEAQQTLGEGFETAIGAVGRGAEQAAMAVRPDQGGYPGIRTGAEVGIQLAPIPGLDAAAGLVSRTPRVGSVARARTRGASEYDSWNFPPQEPPKPPTPTDTASGGAQQGYLFNDPQGIPQDVQSPYNLSQATRDSISEEIRKSTSDQRQGDMFYGDRPSTEPSLAPGGRGLREREQIDPMSSAIGGLESETLASNQARAIGDADRGDPKNTSDLAYRQYKPEDVGPLVEAESKPGFLQSAVDKINLRFDKLKQEELSRPEGQTKQAWEEKNTKPGAEDITSAIDPIPIPAKKQASTERLITQHPLGKFIEYLPIDVVWMLRDHNRLLSPKSAEQFVGKEASVLDNGIFKPLTIKYSTYDGKAVLTNGNTRASLAMKHGLDEVPVHVMVTDKPLVDTEAVNGVVIGKKNLPVGRAKPSDIGLQGRTPNPNAGAPPKADKFTLNKSPAGRQRGGWEITGKTTATPKDMLDVVRRLGDTETRPLKDIVKPLDRTKLSDFGDAETQGLKGMAKSAGRNIVDARTIRALTEGTPLEPIMTWLEKSISKTDRDAKLRLAEDLRGTKYGVGRVNRLLGRNFESRQNSPDGVLPAIDRVAKLGDKISTDFVNTWNKYSGERDDIPFTNSIANAAYQTIQKVLDKRFDSLNSKRALLGKPPVPRMKGYMPIVRPVGDYVLTTLAPDGKKHLYIFPSARAGRRAAAGLKRDFPDLKISDVEHKKPDKLNDGDLSALYATARALSENDPLASAVNKAINQYFTQRGAGGHFRQRSSENIGGYLGDKGDIKELRQSLVSYFEYVNAYEANADRAIIEKQFNEVRISGPEEKGKSVWKQNKKTGGWFEEDASKSSALKDIVPVFHSYATDYIMKSRGALESLDQFDKALVEEVGKGLQLGESAVQRGIYRLNNIATIGFLSKATFVLSQIFQHPMMTPPRLMNVLAKVRTDVGPLGELLRTPNDVARVTASLVKSYVFPMAPWLDVTGHTTKVINYAIKTGRLDPASSHMLEPTTAYNAISKGFYGITGNVEREIVRIPALVAMEDILRPYIKDDVTRYEVATAQMFRAMAGTTRSNSPLLYGKIGPVGTLMRTLKSYSTNWHGQMAEYIANAAKTGDMSHLKVLGTIVGTNSLFAGIMGVPAIPEVTAAIIIFNAVTSSNVRTPQEWFLTNGNTPEAQAAGGTNLGPDLTPFFSKFPDIKNIMVHGLASSMLGDKDIQAQVTPPDLLGLFSIVPAQVPIDMIGPLFKYSVAMAQDQVTDQLRMNMWKGLTLNNPHAKALIEKMFQQPGQPVPRSSQDMAGNFYRDSDDYTRALTTGMLSLREKQADMLYHLFKQNEARLEKDRGSTKKSFVDDFMKGDVSSDKLERYFSQGGSPDALKQDITDTMTKRMMTGMEYEQIRGGRGRGGPGYAQKLQQMQPYLQNPPAGKSLFDFSGNNTPQPRADGGPIEAGKPYLVGEKGPELVVPQSQGSPPSFMGQLGNSIKRTSDNLLIPLFQQLNENALSDMPLQDRPSDPDWDDTYKDFLQRKMWEGFPNNRNGISGQMPDNPRLDRPKPFDGGGVRGETQQPYMVGQNGPEIINPSQAGQVIPTADIQYRGLGGAPVFNDTAPPPSWATQNARQPDSRYRNDIIDPMEQGRSFDRYGIPNDRAFYYNRYTKDRMFTPSGPFPPKKIAM